MIDERELIARAAGSLIQTEPSFEELIHRRDRRRRNQRIRAGVVGVAVCAVVAAAIGPALLRSDSGRRAIERVGGWPEPRTTTTPIVGRDEIVTISPDGRSLVATDLSTGNDRTVLRCPSDCHAIDGYAVSADRGWIAFATMTCPVPGCKVAPRPELWVVGSDGLPTRVTTTAPAWRWSPVGALLAYSDAWQVFLFDPIAGERTEVLSTEGTVAALAWSPDSRSLAYVGEPPGGTSAEDPGVYVIGSDGDPVRVSSNTSVTDISWSPDGVRLVLGWNDGARAGLDVVHTDGTRERTILDGSAFASAGAAVWSPDGERIAYARTPGRSNDYVLEFWVARADGADRILIARYPCCPDPWDGPVWSQDSRRLAFSGDGVRFEVADADGGGEPAPIDRLVVERWRQG